MRTRAKLSPVALATLPAAIAMGQAQAPFDNPVARMGWKIVWTNASLRCDPTDSP